MHRGTNKNDGDKKKRRTIATTKKGDKKECKRGDESKRQTQQPTRRKTQGDNPQEGGHKRRRTFVGMIENPTLCNRSSSGKRHTRKRRTQYPTRGRKGNKKRDERGVKRKMWTEQGRHGETRKNADTLQADTLRKHWGSLAVPVGQTDTPSHKEGDKGRHGCGKTDMLTPRQTHLESIELPEQFLFGERHPEFSPQMGQSQRCVSILSCFGPCKR